MWCLWKSRNDCLFNRKETHPKQIHHMANAVTKSLEMVDVVQVPNSYRLQNEDPTKEKTSEQGETIRTDLAIIGNKIFSDAAWKIRSATGSEDQNQIGIGVYCQALQGKSTCNHSNTSFNHPNSLTTSGGSCSP
jgi:hypothetical protein